MQQNTLYPFSDESVDDLNYSEVDKQQANHYKNIIKSVYIQPNENTQVPLYKDGTEFLNFRQHAGSIFTSWESAGISAIKEDLAVKDLPLYNKIQNPTLVLSNNNYIRNNLTNHSNKFLKTTRMLNNLAFQNGISYDSGSSTPFRGGQMNELNYAPNINNCDGDKVTRHFSENRINLPVNYKAANMFSWELINPAYIIPDVNISNFTDSLRYGTLNLDSIKLTGKYCKNSPNKMNYFVKDIPNNIIPESELPENMYCSYNNNKIILPKNYHGSFKGRDSSIITSYDDGSRKSNISMSQSLKRFIQTDLYYLNRDLISMHLYANSNDVIKQIIQMKHPNLFLKRGINRLSKFEEYNNLLCGEKYNWIYKKQEELASSYQNSLETEQFIKKLNIFKFGGISDGEAGNVGKVKLSEFFDDDLFVFGEGCFVLLPSMLTDHIFNVN